MSSFCLREEPFQESLCLSTRQVLGTEGSNLMEGLGEASRCSEDEIKLPLDFKRFSDIPMVKGSSANKIPEDDGIARIETTLKSTRTCLAGPTSNSAICLDTPNSNVPSLPVPCSGDQTSNMPGKKEHSDLKRESSYSHPRHRSSDRISSTSISSSTSVMKLKALRDSAEPGSSIFSPNKGSKSGVLCRRLDECAHFHYEVVELKTVELSLVEDNFENDFQEKWLVIEVFSKERQWKVRRSYQSLHQMDKQLHDCIFKRKFSLLPELTENLVEEEGHIRARGKVCTYFDRLTTLPVSRINCGPVLCWMEMDNRGNRVILQDSDSAINIPAVAAAHSIKSYTAQSIDELSLKVGDILSIIDKPPSNESNWWRGKKEFEVGFFPSDCVELLDSEKIPQSIASRCSVSTHLKHTSSIGPKNKLKSLLMSFFSTRPNRSSLKRSGIVKERLFACDLGEHLLNSDEEVPTILKCCAEVLEVHGIVDGIYRLSGAASTINKLRNEFDEGRIPDLTSEAYIQDIHSVSSLLKMYFRELPNPLLTYELYDKFIEAITGRDEGVRLSKICDVIKQLPPPHYRTAEYLFRHLNKMASQDDITSMHCKNLAIVWAPNLLRSKELEQMKCGTAALRGVGIQAVVTEYLIKNVCFIFNEENQGTEDGMSTAETNRTKASSPMPTTQKLLTLEEAQERKSQLVSTHLRQKNFIEVGGGAANLPVKYHTIINFPKDKKKLREKLPSPSRFRTLFRRSQSTSFKENSEVVKQSSVRDKKTSSVGAEVSLKVESNSNKRNLSTSALLSNGTPAGDASFGILDDFKRLSTSCEIPAEQSEKHNKIKNKKLKGKHRSTSVDIASCELNVLLIELGDNSKKEVVEASEKAKQQLNVDKVSMRNKSVVIKQQSSALEVTSVTMCNTKEKLKKSKKSKLHKEEPRGDCLKLLPSEEIKRKVSEAIDSRGCSVTTTDEELLDDIQLDKPVLASDESDFKSDSLETFEVVHASGAFVSCTKAGPDIISANDEASAVDESVKKNKTIEVSTFDNKNVEFELKQDISDCQQLRNCSSNDLLSWSLSSDVTGKDLYKELSPTLNNIWMGSGCYRGSDECASLALGESKTVEKIGSGDEFLTLTSEIWSRDGTIENVSDAPEVHLLSTKNLINTSDLHSSKMLKNVEDCKNYLRSSITEEDLAQKLNNFHVALNILEHSCDLQPRSSVQSENLNTSQSDQNAKENEVFLPIGCETSYDQNMYGENYTSLNESPKARPTIKSTSSVPSSNQNEPSSTEVLSDAALDLFSFNRMYSSESLSHARLQVSNEDGYVYASYRDLYCKMPIDSDRSSILNHSLTSAPITTSKDENEIMRRIASYGSPGERTVMMPVGNAAKKSDSSQHTKMIRNTIPNSSLSVQVEGALPSKSRDFCPHASTDPLKRKENVYSSPASNSSRDSYHDKNEFLFRPSSEKTSAFRNHHHRNSTRLFNTPSPEIFHSSTTPQLQASQSRTDFHGTASARLTSMETKMLQNLTSSNQPKDIETSKSSDQPFSKPQQPSVIILNRPSITIKNETQQKSLAFSSQNRHSAQCSAKPKEQTWHQKGSSDSPLRRQFTWSQEAADCSNRKSSSGTNTPSGKQPLTSANIQFLRSISLDEKNEAERRSTSSKRQVGLHLAAQSSRRPFERLETCFMASGHSVKDEKAEQVKFSNPFRCSNDSHPFQTPFQKSSHSTNHNTLVGSPPLRVNQNFVLTKKQLFENNTNC